MMVESDGESVGFTEEYTNLQKISEDYLRVLRTYAKSGQLSAQEISLLFGMIDIWNIFDIALMSRTKGEIAYKLAGAIKSKENRFPTY